MKKPELQSMTEDERLDRVLEEVALGVELEQLLEELVPEENPWWDGEGAFELDEMATETVPVVLTWKNRLSSMLDQMSDWALVAERYLKIGTGELSAVKMAHAATLADPARKSAPQVQYRSWQQGDMSLTLSVERTKPFSVTLRIDNGPDLRLTRLAWIDEDVSPVDPLGRPGLQAFPMVPTENGRAFKVKVPGKKVMDRLKEIEEVLKTDGESKARRLLPFVEWN